VLVSAVFLADTFQRLQHADIGFDPEQIISARVAMFTQAPGRSPEQYFGNVIDAIEQIAGVEQVAAVSQLPLSGAMLGSTFLAGNASDDRRIDVDLRSVTTGYFRLMGIPMLRGRTFDDRDTATTRPIVVVDETFARTLSPDGNVIGQRVRWFRQPETEIEIVGVVGAVRHRSLEETPRPTVYRPLSQYPRTSMYVVVKTNADPIAVVDQMIAAVGAVTPAQPVADVATMEDRIGRATSRARTSVMLAATLAALAVLLAVVGVYGVLSFGVAQRRREFGVPLALGASPMSIRRMILRDGLLLTAAGCAFGVLAAWSIARGASSLLFENSPGDLAPYAVGTLLVVICSMLAFWIPARRASTVSPTVALRQD
jgi:predicted permease